MTSDDIMYRNHAVAKNAKDSMIDSEERVIIQFSRLVLTENGKKYIRANVNFGMSQFKEVIKNYGLELANRWEIWQPPTKEMLTANPKAKGKNVPFQD